MTERGHKHWLTDGRAQEEETQYQTELKLQCTIKNKTWLIELLGASDTRGIYPYSLTPLQRLLSGVPWKDCAEESVNRGKFPLCLRRPRVLLAQSCF